MTRWRLLILLTLVVIGALLWHGSRPPPQRHPKADLVQRDGVWHLKANDAPFTGIMFEQSDKGLILTEVPLSEGLAHGIARGWHTNGQLEVEEPFVKGKSHGTRTRYHANGKVRSIATIAEGVLQGPFREYHDNGQLAVEMALVDGKGQGPSRAWHPSGLLKAEVTLVDGEPTATSYHEDK